MIFAFKNVAYGQTGVHPEGYVDKMNENVTPDTDLLYEVRDGIGRIIFNRPQARNSLTFGMYERLAAICEAAADDRSLKVLILSGAGDKAFAAGTDINQFRAFNTPQDAIGYEVRIDRVLTTLEQCRVPTIAAINGACTGGGAGIAACCDLRIGTRIREVRISDRAHARQLPVGGQYRPALGPDRGHAAQGDHLYRAADRSRGSRRHRLAARSRGGSPRPRTTRR